MILKTLETGSDLWPSVNNKELEWHLTSELQLKMIEENGAMP